MHGHHLTIEDREIIAQMRAAGLSQARIARRLHCHPSTISRELRRNADSPGLYLPSRAQASRPPKAPQQAALETRRDTPGRLRQGRPATVLVPRTDSRSAAHRAPGRPCPLGQPPDHLLLC